MVHSQTSSSCPAKGQSSQLLCKCCTLQDAGLGQESFKCEKLCQPHRIGPQQEQRDCFLGSLSPDRTGGRRDRNVCQTSKCPKCGTHLPVGSRLTLFRDLGSLGGGETLGSTNVEGGLHSPFPVKTKLDKVTQNYQLLCTSSQEPILVRSITSAYGQRMVQSSQFKISGLLQPFLVPKPHNHWRPILGLSKPNLSETIRTTLQQWEWVTSIDFKDAYFHIPI